MPWHDVGVAVEGPAARDVARSPCLSSKRPEMCVIHDVQAFYSAVEPSEDGEAQIQPKPPISCAKGFFAKYSQYAISLNMWVEARFF